MEAMVQHSWHWKPFAAMVRMPSAAPSFKAKRGFRSCPVRIRAQHREELKAVEDLAVQLARQAGAIILENAGRAFKVNAKSSRMDLVTEVDKACEQLIHSGVKDAFPEHLWLGEETATTAELENFDEGPIASSWTWIVDPIDGTLNFIAGVPFSSVSIAVARGKNTEVGVIYNPYMDECFQARKGQGAFLNGNKITVVPGETKLEDVIVTLGFTTKREGRKAMLEAISKVGPHCRTVRSLGSAALHICYVAAGRVGCFFEHELKVWDIAAARLVLEEAGGLVSAMDGKPLPLGGGSILATGGGQIHDRIVKLLL